MSRQGPERTRGSDPGPSSSGDEDASLRFLAAHPSLFAALEPRGPQGHAGQLPQQVAGYAVLEVLGRGGMGIVARAVRLRDGEHVALKLAHESAPELFATLKRESLALLAVEHPHIVSALDAGVSEGWAWLAMELVEGSTLAEWIARERESPSLTARTRTSDVMRWFAELAGALSALHAAGLVHRDVKPSNVLLRTDGSACLIDLGLACASAAPAGMHRALVGTLPYLSPEQTLGGLIAVRPTSDLYSLAATMLEALSLRRLVTSEARAEAVEAIAFAPSARPSELCGDLPRSLDRIFARALEKDARKRTPSADALAADVQAWREDRRPPFAGEPLAAAWLRRVRRRPLLCALGLAATLALGASWRASVTAQNRAVASALQSLAQSLRAGSVDRTIEQILALPGALREDPRVAEFCTHHAGELGSALARRALRTASVRIPGTTAVSGTARFTAELLALAPRPQIVFAHVLEVWIEAGPDAAGAALEKHREPASQSRLLGEIEALLAAERGDAIALGSAESALETFAEELLDPLGLGFRAYRFVRCAAQGRIGIAGFADRRARDLEMARETLELAEGSGAGGELVRITRALLAWEIGEPAVAAESFRALAEVRWDPALRLHEILAHSLAEGAPPADGTELLAELGTRAQIAPGALRCWLARAACGFADLELAAEWLHRGRVEERADAADIVEAAYEIMQGAMERREVRLVGPLADTVCRLALDPLPPEPEALRSDLLLLGIWTDLHLARSSTRVPEQRDGRLELIARVRARCEQWTLRELPTHLELRAARIGADLLQAISEGIDAAASDAADVHAAKELLAEDGLPPATAEFLRELIREREAAERTPRGR